MSKPTDLVQGTLDLLILKVVALEPMHGWAIAHRIHQMSAEVLQVGQSALYPALHKLEQHGWVEAEWKISETNRRAKYYSLTRAGRRPPRAGIRKLREAGDGHIGHRAIQLEEKTMRRFITRTRLVLRSIFRRRRVDEDLDAELQFHLQHEIERRIEAGLPLGSGAIRRAARYGRDH